MCFVFKRNEIKKIYVATDERENVLLAVNDFIKDIQSVCGDAVLTNSCEEADIYVASMQSKEFSAIAGNNVNFTHEEEFCYSVKNEKLYLLGADDLGTMWAIYTFLEKELKIPPFYFFEDIQVECKEQIQLENKTVQEYPHTKFRGWFINDEDLLSGFQSKGKRDIDYIFYKDVRSD